MNPPITQVSLNEVEVTIKRAARGAGYSWGLAEEAGKAARWLAAYRLPCVDVFADLLNYVDGKDYLQLKAENITGTLRGNEGPLCPIIAGSSLSDMVLEISKEMPVFLGQTSHPIILLAFLGRAAADTGRSFSVSWEGSQSSLSREGPSIIAVDIDLTATSVDKVHVSLASQVEIAEILPEFESGIIVNDSAWKKLQTLAARTFVPATDKSRVSGAGAGMNDSD